METTANMTIFPQDKPVSNFDLDKLRQGKSLDSYVKKLEETVNYLSGKIKKNKKDQDGLKAENQKLLEDLHRKTQLMEKISSSWKKEIAKRKDLEQKVGGATVFVKQGGGLQKVQKIDIHQDSEVTEDKTPPEQDRASVMPTPDPDALGEELDFRPDDIPEDMPGYFEASTILCDPEHLEDDQNVEGD